MTVSKAMYSAVYNDQRGNLDAFLSNVFKQLDVEKFHEIMEDALGTSKDGNEVYEKLLKRCPEANKGLFSKLGALKEEKQTLKDNLAKVIDPKRPLKNYVEIGFPGRMIRSLQKIAPLQGNITVVNSAESLADLAQSGFPRPYHTFKQLDYNPLPLAEESNDVIGCYIGLHHCPEDKLDAFVASISKTLRPGGIFLLRDHDASSKEMKELAAVVHAVFNAGTGVILQDEIDEVRNFQGLEYWKKLLDKHGLTCVSDSLVRHGDSTQNGLLKFVKAENALSVVRERLINQFRYVRPREQTYLTFTEWFNVESAQNLPNAKSFWDYSYFSDVARLWKGFWTSWKEARSVQSFSGVLFSDYTLMNGFIATMMSVDYIAKGIISTPLWLGAKLEALLPKKARDTAWEKPAEEYTSWLKKYSDRLETTTFYALEYLPAIGEFWKNFAASWNEARTKGKRALLDLLFDRQTIKNVVVGGAMTTDLFFRALTSTPVNWLFGGQELADARSIGLIVKTNQKFKDKEIQVLIDDKKSSYKGIVLPRYKKLEAILKDFAKKGIEVVEIAGQTEIMIDIVRPRESEEALANTLHERDYLPDASKKITSVLVMVKELHTFLKKHEMSVHRIYDF